MNENTEQDAAERTPAADPITRRLEEANRASREATEADRRFRKVVVDGLGTLFGASVRESVASAADECLSAYRAEALAYGAAVLELQKRLEVVTEELDRRVDEVVVARSDARHAAKLLGEALRAARRSADVTGRRRPAWINRFVGVAREIFGEVERAYFEGGLR